jgi:hypothetical protein
LVRWGSVSIVLEASTHRSGSGGGGSNSAISSMVIAASCFLGVVRSGARGEGGSDEGVEKGDGAVLFEVFARRIHGQNLFHERGVGEQGVELKAPLLHVQVTGAAEGVHDARRVGRAYPGLCRKLEEGRDHESARLCIQAWPLCHGAQAIHHHPHGARLSHVLEENEEDEEDEDDEEDEEEARQRKDKEKANENSTEQA